MLRKIVLSFVAATLCMLAWGQDNVQWKRHSLELSTGYPLYLRSKHYVPVGKPAAEPPSLYPSYKPVWPLNLTLSYSYRFTKLWAVGGRFNTQGWFYREYTEASPEEGKFDFDTGGLIPAMFVRLYWLSGERVALYSSLGAGVNIRSKVQVVPDIILIGIQGSRKTVYLHSELSFGLAGIGLLAGVGVRLF